MNRIVPILFFAACSGSNCAVDSDVDNSVQEPVTVRFATFNVSMYRERAGGLVRSLSDPDNEQARFAAAILQEVRPDVVLLSEVDWDADADAVRLLRDNFLERSQDGREPLIYEHVVVPTVNTGVHSGVDLNGDGSVVASPGARGYGDDALGFGEYPGQYGLVVLSRFPIDASAVRTFQDLLWRDVPGNLIPDGVYSNAALDVLPLSSKTHADIPVQVGDATVHVLVSHPTPPSFDGPEDRNGRRNHDEIAFWTDYLDAGSDSWQVDDAGVRGGLDGSSFVVMGDLNADPNDGDSTGGAITALLAHPRVTATSPASAGGVEQADLQQGRNQAHSGDPAYDTTDFNDQTVGNLRLDYVLPSVDLPVLDSGVFWPLADDPLFPLVGTFPFPVSDHRLTWVDVAVGPTPD